MSASGATFVKPEKPIGGWLFLPVIGTFTTPIAFLIDLFQSGAAMFANLPAEVWALLLINGIVDVAFTVAWCFAINAMANRLPSYPKIFIILMLSGVLWNALAIFVLAPGVIPIDPKETGKLIYYAIAAAVWCPYMLLSRRVADTFGWPRPRVPKTLTPTEQKCRSQGNRLGIFVIVVGVAVALSGGFLTDYTAQAGAIVGIVGIALAVSGWPLARLWFWFKAAA